MNLRALSLTAATAALIATAAGAQAQGGYAPTPPYTDVQAVAAGSAYGFLTNAQTQALLTAIAQTFVPGFTPSSPGTISGLLTNSPASAANVGQYAVVSDLYGGTNEVLRSGYTASVGYYWRPQRTDYASNLIATGGTVTLTPLQNAPYEYLTGTLATSLTINLSSSNAWPGASFCVSNNLTMGLFTLNLSGLGLPSTNIIGGANKCVVFDGSAWRPF